MSGREVTLGGYSDDCSCIAVTGGPQTDNEYTAKRARIRVGGVEFVATLAYTSEGWATTLTLPEGAEVVLEERMPDEWVPAETWTPGKNL